MKLVRITSISLSISSSYPSTHGPCQWSKTKDYRSGIKVNKNKDKHPFCCCCCCKFLIFNLLRSQSSTTTCTGALTLKLSPLRSSPDQGSVSVIVVLVPFLLILSGFWKMPSSLSLEISKWRQSGGKGSLVRSWRFFFVNQFLYAQCIMYL